MSLGNSNSLFHCSLFPLFFLFRHVVLSVSSSCLFPNVLFFQLSPFLLLNTPYSSHSPALSTDLYLGFPHFYPFCWDGPFSAAL